MGRPEGTTGIPHGRRMGRLLPVAETVAERSDREQREWEEMIRGVQTRRIGLLRRTLYEVGADHQEFARSLKRGLANDDPASWSTWLETMGFKRAEEIRQYTLLVAEATMQVVLPFIPDDRRPQLLAALAEKFGEKGPRK